MRAKTAAPALALLLLLLSACGAPPAEESAPTALPAPEETQKIAEEAAEETAEETAEEAAEETAETEEKTMLCLKIGDTAVTVNWEDNASVQALAELCREEALTVRLSRYGGFEQVGPLGTSLPREDKQTTTGAGDVVLYAGNQIVVFYGSNTWAYTRLGHITDKSAEELTALLGSGDQTLTLWLEGER